MVLVPAEGPGPLVHRPCSSKQVLAPTCIAAAIEGIAVDNLLLAASLQVMAQTQQLCCYAVDATAVDGVATRAVEATGTGADTAVVGILATIAASIADITSDRVDITSC